MQLLGRLLLHGGTDQNEQGLGTVLVEFDPHYVKKCKKTCSPASRQGSIFRLTSEKIKILMDNLKREYKKYWLQGDIMCGKDKRIACGTVAVFLRRVKGVETDNAGIGYDDSRVDREMVVNVFVGSDYNCGCTAADSIGGKRYNEL